MARTLPTGVDVRKDLAVELSQVSVACGSAHEAERVVDVLLDRRLAACVQVLGPMTSCYWWQGSREVATEWVCVIKTRTSLVDEVAAAVRSVHSYDLPEVLAVPVTGGDPEYLAWIEAEASGAPERHGGPREGDRG
jgi:periplasmic divalent cation tolerance protein